MTRRRVKVGLIVVALVVLALEGYLLYGYYDRYYGDASPGTGVSAFEETTGFPATDPGDIKSPGASEAAVPLNVEGGFVHRSTEGNSRGDYTYLSDPGIDGDPNAVVFAEPSGSSGSGASSGDATYDHNVGVWFEPDKRRWAIFNQDLAPVPAGATFEVAVPPAERRFVHRATTADIVGNTTYLNDPLTNGKPDAIVTVTQSWNPGGGGGGVYNNHPVEVLYDEDVERWIVYNDDGARMPDGAAFNVTVAGETEPAR